MRSYIKSVFFGVMIFLLAMQNIGCASKKQLAEQRRASQADAATLAAIMNVDVNFFDESERYALALDHFVLARDQERRGNTEVASRLYQAAFDFWPQSRFLRNILTDIYVRENSYDRLLSLFFRDGETLDSLSIEEARLVVVAHLRLGNVNEAMATLEFLGENLSEDEVYSLALLYSSTGDNEKAIKAIIDVYGISDRSAALGLRLAQLNMAERRLSSAQSLSKILRELFPNNAEIAALLGAALYASGDTTEAVGHLSAALKLDPLNINALRNLAQIQAVRNNYREAIPLHRRLIALGDPLDFYRRLLAYMLYQVGDYDEALSLLTELLERNATGDRDEQELLSYRGLTFLMTNRHAEAIKDFEAAIKIDSSHETPWRELCYAFIAARNIDSAQTCTERYTRSFPKSGMAWKLRALMFDLKKDYPNARDALVEAINIDSTDNVAWTHLGNVLLDGLKLNEEAMDAFGTALRMNPRDPIAANNLGYMWADAGINLDSARVLIRFALDTDPQNSAYLDSYAWVLYRLGDYTQALEYINKAIELADEPSHVLYEHKGDILFKLKNFLDAEVAYRRSLELESENADRIRTQLDKLKMEK